MIHKEIIPVYRKQKCCSEKCIMLLLNLVYAFFYTCETVIKQDNRCRNMQFVVQNFM